MKQCITKEQVDEIRGNYPAMDKLNDWVSEHGYKDEGWADFLTIGRMIEFLGDEWEAAIERLNENGTWKLPPIRELCDALWKVVKQKLEA